MCRWWIIFVCMASISIWNHVEDSRGRCYTDAYRLRNRLPFPHGDSPRTRVGTPLQWHRIAEYICEDESQAEEDSERGSSQATAHALEQTGDKKCLQYLEKIVQKFNGGVERSIHIGEDYSRHWVCSVKLYHYSLTFFIYIHNGGVNYLYILF